MKRLLFVSYAAFALLRSMGQSPSVLGSVPLDADVDSTAHTITLHWPLLEVALGYTVSRRAVGGTDWPAPIATLPLLSTSYVDADVEVGVPYEYKVERQGLTTGYGYLRSGIAVPAVENRGAVVLLVSSGLIAPLSAQLDQLRQDLQGDGWRVIRHDVPANAQPADVRAMILADHAAAPDEVKAVYILGHVPVPYSGSISPDGHQEHAGAWPCDGYYADVDGLWTDTQVNNTSGSFLWNHNVPGDGKWDQSDLPGVELQVGRVDLSRLPTLGTNTVLTSAYLAKAHAWRTAAFTVPSTAAVWDNLTWLGTPVASAGYQSASSGVGLVPVQDLSPLVLQFKQHYLTTNDLFTYHCSTGLQVSTANGTVFSGTDHGLTIDDLAGNSAGGVFNMSMGSYFGDWDNTDNFLRAVIGSGNALAHMWCGIPNWFLHPMAMGETIGYCTMRTMNNTNADYALQNGGFQGPQIGRSHLALMGDPTLRMHYIAPPTALVATNDQWYASFHWSPSPGAVVGYHIYRIDDVTGAIVRITGQPVQDTTYLAANVPFVPGAHFMVRALQLVTSPSGSYYDLSLGAHAIAQGQAVADCAGVLGGTAIPGTPCDDGDPLTTGEVYDTLCVCTDFTGIGSRVLEPFAAWPSPAQAELSVRVPASGELTVRDMSGALLSSRSVKTMRCTVDVRRFAAGTYILEYRSAYGRADRLRFEVMP